MLDFNLVSFGFWILTLSVVLIRPWFFGYWMLTVSLGLLGALNQTTDNTKIASIPSGHKSRIAQFFFFINYPQASEVYEWPLW
jgi:hypothetical protein